MGLFDFVGDVPIIGDVFGEVGDIYGELKGTGQDVLGSVRGIVRGVGQGVEGLGGMLNSPIFTYALIFGGVYLVVSATKSRD